MSESEEIPVQPKSVARGLVGLDIDPAQLKGDLLELYTDYHDLASDESPGDKTAALRTMEHEFYAAFERDRDDRLLAESLSEKYGKSVDDIIGILNHMRKVQQAVLDIEGHVEASLKNSGINQTICDLGIDFIFREIKKIKGIDMVEHALYSSKNLDV